MGDDPKKTHISAVTHPSLTTKLGSNAKIRLYPTVRYENFQICIETIVTRENS